MYIKVVDNPFILRIYYLRYQYKTTNNKKILRLERHKLHGDILLSKIISKIKKRQLIDMVNHYCSFI
jgi:hypothetical protein